MRCDFFWYRRVPSFHWAGVVQTLLVIGLSEDNYVLTISKEFHFSASHVLHELPLDHPCGRMHGHNYIVVIELSAPPDQLSKAGFVRDFGELDVVKSWIDAEIDHRHLNDVLGGLNPSAEQIAQWIFDNWKEKFPELTAIRVSETPRTWAEYRPLVHG
jgi:6-pyruvoyltetrahydropterin/6-carboxytetrahydropterin synthase